MNPVEQSDNVIELSGRIHSVEVRGLGQCTVRGPSLALDMELADDYKRPFSVDYGAFCDRLLAGCLVEPALRPSGIARLPEHARARLRTVVAEQSGTTRDVRALRGSHLSGDERLFAAMFWRYERWTARMGEVILGFGVAAQRELATSLAPVMQAWRRRQEELLAPLRNITRGILGPPPLVRQMSRIFAGNEAFSVAHQSPPSNAWTQHLALSGERRRFSLPSTGVGQVNSDLMSRIRASSAFAGSSGLPGVPARHLSPALLDRLQVPSPGLTRAVQGLRPFLRYLHEEYEEHRQTEAFMRRWETSSYWFLLSLVTRASTRPLYAMSTAELEATVLDALESAVRDSRFAGDVRRSVEHAPLLTDVPRRHLIHGLEHATRSEWVDALPPLLNGLEGAFWRAARELNVINDQRFLSERPTKLIKSVDTLFKHLPATPSYKSFLKHRVFGSGGNSYRHGDAEGGERRQVLFAIAALVGWLEEFAETPAAYELGTRLEGHLLSLAA